MTVERYAGILYDIYASDPLGTATLTAQRTELLASAGELDVTSFTINGQSAAGTRELTRLELIEAITLALRDIAAGARTKYGRTYPVFS